MKEYISIYLMDWAISFFITDVEERIDFIISLGGANALKTTAIIFSLGLIWFCVSAHLIQYFNKHCKSIDRLAFGFVQLFYVNIAALGLLFIMAGIAMTICIYQIAFF